MIDVLEVFEGVKNVKFHGFTYCEEVREDLPVFVLKEEITEEWNRKARIQNTKMFSEIFGRQPKDYEEVLRWVTGFIPKKKQDPLPVKYVQFA